MARNKIILAAGGITTTFGFATPGKEKGEANQQQTEYFGRRLIAYLYHNVSWRFWEAMEEELKYIQEEKPLSYSEEDHYKRIEGLFEHECTECGVKHKLGSMIK